MFALTPRLALRPPWPEDAPALEMALRDPAVALPLAMTPWRHACSDPAAWLARPHAAHEPRFLIMTRGGDGRMLGGVTVEDGEFNVWLTSTASGRGHATEAGRAVIEIVRHALGRRRLIARSHAPRVMRMLARLGFQPLGGGLHEWSIESDALRIAA